MPAFGTTGALVTASGWQAAAQPASAVHTANRNRVIAWSSLIVAAAARAAHAGGGRPAEAEGARHDERRRRRREAARQEIGAGPRQTARGRVPHPGARHRHRLTAPP